jgi:hypothetical protein
MNWKNYCAFERTNEDEDANELCAFHGNAK